MIRTEDIAFFKSIVGDQLSLLDADLKHYGHDETEDLSFPPHIVLKPSDPKQISAILAYCHTNKIPVTPAGARTGLSGGALPVYGGVLLSMEKFNKILSID